MRLSGAFRRELASTSKKSAVIQLTVQEQNRAIKDFDAVGCVRPRREFLRRMANAAATGDEDHAHGGDLGDFLSVLDGAAR